MSVKIYVEGAGRGRKQQAELRKGFKKLLDQVVTPGSFSIQACGSRSKAYGDFCKALRKNERAFLLVDAEEIVADENRSTPWRHVETRLEDKWKRPDSASDTDLHLMAVVMETWFLADPETLKRLHPRDFSETAVKKWPDLEQVPKEKVFQAVEKLTGRSIDRTKGERSFSILAELDASKVVAACSFAKRLKTAIKNAQPNDRSD